MEKERKRTKQILNHAINAKSLSQMLPEAARQKTRKKVFLKTCVEMLGRHELWMESSGSDFQRMPDIKLE